MPEFTPTDEQTRAVEIATGGAHMAVEALAGTGKTSTLRLIAEAKPQQGTYVAFNKAIVTEAKGKFPRNVKCSTAHSLAFQSVGRRYSHRLRGGRMRSAEIASRLGIEAEVVATSHGTKYLAPAFLAGLTMRAVARFCQTADAEISKRHVPTPRAVRDDPVLSEMYDDIREILDAPMKRAWRDIMDPKGQLPYTHGCYLKTWQLEDPKILTDFILFDEAQDANPVMLAIVEAQRDHAQLVFVGDRFQQIYEWNGAVNAMENAPVDQRTYLTHSFRFGPEIAEVANEILGLLGAEAFITGRGAPGSVGALDSPDVILSRTNAVAVSEALREMTEGGRPHIVGGADDVVSFARAAKDLMGGRYTMHPELSCFETWGEVLAYVQQDELGSELKLLVDLVTEFGVDTIVDSLGRQAREADATLVLSTAHKAKGREWPTVQIAGDMPDNVPDAADEQKRLLYVASTRPRTALDVESVDYLRTERQATATTAGSTGQLFQ